jgi:hydroxymethylglutaryl-CoA lyase
VLGRIAKRASEAGRQMVAYVSMAFGNPYDDPWSEERVVEVVEKITDLGICSISLADTIGVADLEMISRLVSAVKCDCDRCDVGVHLHSTRGEAAGKILAAYDAGCRRFDSALGGLGGCPFAQDTLVGNIPTEEVLAALSQREVRIPLRDAQNAIALNNEIASQYTAPA